MLRNLGVISIVLFASQLLAIVQQCVAHKNTTWMRKNDDVIAFRVTDDGKFCHCLFVPQFEGNSYGYAEGYDVLNTGAYKFHTVGETWNEARNICHNEGAHLAVINSQEELEMLNDFFERKMRYDGEDVQADRKDLAYLGVHNYFGKDSWTAVTGPWVRQDNFNPWNRISNGKCGGDWVDQPNNYGGKQHCGALILPCKAMDDHECDKKLAFICEKPDLWV